MWGGSCFQMEKEDETFSRRVGELFKEPSGSEAMILLSPSLHRKQGKVSSTPQ